jgi:hypothetical protein
VKLALGIAAAVYVVFLLGMAAGQSWVTTCVRSHMVDAGPDSFTVCDYRVTNGKTIDIGSPFAALGIPHIPGGPYGIIGYGSVLVVLLVVGLVWRLDSRAARPSGDERRVYEALGRLWVLDKSSNEER